jgi:hypothetical protein
LGGCDVVLGVEWLRTLGPVLWDFQLMTMAFNQASHHVILQGLHPSGFTLEDGDRFLKPSASGIKGFFLQLGPSHPSGSLGSSLDRTFEPLDVAFQSLLSDFESVFDELAGLPPPRSQDHQIILHDSKPVNVRPYRYPYFQKTEIEKIVKELLASRVIRPEDGLMNEVFKPFLRRFVLVFFDDILVYSTDLSTHILHLRLVLEVLHSNQLYAKRSKCCFGVTEIEYLGHLISSQGVRANRSKLASMTNWPIPRNIKSLREFLGLTGYYRKFIRGYGILAVPLTALLKNAFTWTTNATDAFNRLKTGVTTPLVLRLPDFTKAFTIEYDACGTGLGAVLM